MLVDSAPDVTCTLLSPADEFVVVGCDGVWDVLSNQVCPPRRRAPDPKITVWRVLGVLFCLTASHPTPKLSALPLSPKPRPRKAVGAHALKANIIESKYH